MAKKRKAGGGKPFGHASDHAPNVRTKYGADETLDDSEDEFYAGRDKILLEERPEVKRRRRIDKDNEFLQASDEEVLGYDEPSDDELDEDADNAGDDYRSHGSGAGDVGEEEAGGLGDFGRSKSDYYNADIIQTEEDALEEEKEARRLQQMQLENITEADFGFDEAQWFDRAEHESKGQGKVTEKLPALKIAEDASEEERLGLLKSRYPEFEHLAKDFVDLQPLHEDLRLSVEATEAALKHSASLSRKRKLARIDGESQHTPVAITKFRALSAYLGGIGVYLALITSSYHSTSSLALAPSELREHPAIRSLVQCRQLWEAVKDVPIPDVQDTVIHDLFDSEASVEISKVIVSKEKKPRKKKSRAERAAITAEKIEAATRQARVAAVEASFADLESLVAPRGSKVSKAIILSRPSDNASDFGDEAPLTAEEAAAKAQRKKSLRFYTSQIAQKANKRGMASRDAGGDTDLPYKERLRDRQERLNREAEKRGKAGADLDDDDGSSGEGPTNAERREAARRGGNTNSDSDDEYYQTIVYRNANQKASKKAAAAAAAAASQRPDAHPEDGLLANDPKNPEKRGITREILRNKGLTPHRKKDVRNPRVKKKKKYEEKMKKLRGSGQRKVYNPHSNGGAANYGGERTGINMRVVRSVKL